MNKVVFALVAVASMAACGSDGPGTASGVPGNRQISDLTDAEAMKTCVYIADFIGPEHTVTCADGTMGTVGLPAADRDAQIADCLAGITDARTMYPNCDITINDLEACYDAIGALDDEMRYCTMNPVTPAACTALDTKGSSALCSAP